MTKCALGCQSQRVLLSAAHGIFSLDSRFRGNDEKNCENLSLRYFCFLFSRRKHVKRWLLGMLLVLLACTALASSNRTVGKASMLVIGWIDVRPDGSVRDHGLALSDTLPQIVRKLVDNKVSGWKFRFDKPVDTVQHETMYLRITVTPVDDKHDSIAIGSASFVDANWKRTDHPFLNELSAVYPHAAKASHVTGTVYLALRINRQGKVEKAAVEQVDLDVYGPEKLLSQFRDLLANAVVEGVKSTTFNLPSTGSHVGDSYWDIRQPVPCRIITDGVPPMDNYRILLPYNPGPIQLASWLPGDAQAAMPPDANFVVTAAQGDASVHLVTPLPD
jgi:hypothetical protein